MTTAAVQTNLNVVWTLIAAILVFMMQAGFALVETGFTRAKNAANIMMKNLMDFAAGSLAFYILGAALMFGASKLGGWLGWGGLGMPSLATGEGVWDWTFLFFQTMFAATAATIVSGAVAERIEFKSYLIYSVLVSCLVYPISGHWMWGSLAGDASRGWLEALGFHDFAGSTVVHSVGGWIALAGALALGPRIGKYRPDGKANYGNEMVGLFYGGGFTFLGIQALGALATAAWAFGTGVVIFFALKKLGILRVSPKTELKGLDLTEHGQDAYASFQFFSNM